FQDPPVLSTKLTVAALPIVLHVAQAGLANAAEKSISGSVSSWSPLLRRQPSGFDRRTLEHIAAAVRNIPSHLPKLLEFVGHQHQALGRGGALMLLLLFVAVAYGPDCAPLQTGLGAAVATNLGCWRRMVIGNLGSGRGCIAAHLVVGALGLNTGAYRL